jgi:hypothetical protein
MSAVNRSAQGFLPSYVSLPLLFVHLHQAVLMPCAAEDAVSLRRCGPLAERDRLMRTGISRPER